MMTGWLLLWALLDAGEFRKNRAATSATADDFNFISPLDDERQLTRPAM
jgi:hypothetical protein